MKLEDTLREITACPLCGDADTDARSRAEANLYSEQLALLLGCDEAELLIAVGNVRCVGCGLWYKARWFPPPVLEALFARCVPDHPKGWDAVSDRFSAQGYASAVDDLARALDGGSDADLARCRRALCSIIDSVQGIDGPAAGEQVSLRVRLLLAVAAGDIEMLAVSKPVLHARFADPAPFKRFSGFSSPLLWAWMQSHLGPVQRYAEVGCPLWGQLARPMDAATQRWYFTRSEPNYWGPGCCRGERHCSARLDDEGQATLGIWPPPEGIALDALGAFQYLDHLASPAAFVTEAFRHARALLLVLDDGAAPSAIQHATGWGARPIAWLARRHGKRVVDDFAAIKGSGNHAWLLCDG